MRGRPEGPGDTAKIREALAATGKTYTQIAEQMGVTVASVSAYAAGARKPAAGNLGKLAQALGIHVSKLLREDTSDAA
ncbi:Helix-turn-helix [Saccharopolyspora antimicrobica]|uniref:Helix-turn-helix n=1 Tax=Saccharopolyspora antimicrobica TaxID=455193 RepID=A0A1I5FFD9_9PSEU|nr:helix-turn-helix protein [Saccharopolyspora antimicrobica]SFO22343.1 Helix-turn-helix [Saccharopolyspora antimicrobica]